MKKILKLSILAVTLAFTANCSIFGTSDDDDDQSLAAAALVLLGQGCTVGTGVFSAAGVTCSGGSATGTGILASSATHGDDLSIQLNYQLQSGGSIYLVGGFTSSTIDINNGAGLFVQTGSITGIRPSNPTGTASGLAAPGTNAGVLCLDVHFDETPDHILATTAACPASAVNVSNATLDSENTAISGTADATGTNWGLILNNATITNVTVYSSKRFTE